jgi:aerobic C4-dicarboxylate transport protein
MFVANFYQVPLAVWDHLQILVLSIFCALASRAMVGSGTLIMAGYMNQFFQLPFEAVLPAFVIIDVVVSGFKSVLSVLLSCAVISMISKGLTPEIGAEDAEWIQCLKVRPCFLPFAQGAFIMLAAMVLALLVTVFSMGLGLGASMPDGLHFSERPPHFLSLMFNLK